MSGAEGARSGGAQGPGHSISGTLCPDAQVGMYFPGQWLSLRGGRDGITQRKVPYSALSTGWGTLAREGTSGQRDVLG